MTTPAAKAAQAAKAAEQQRRSRQNRRAQRIPINGRLHAPLPPERHGNESTYNNWGCQCQPCTNAHRDRQRVEAELKQRLWQQKRARLQQAGKIRE